MKRRYRSSEDDEKLKRLDYFNHPYEPGNTIKLIDDLDLPESVSLYSLSSQFVSLEDTKRGKKNAIQRKEINEVDKITEFGYEPFDLDKSRN